MRVTVSVGGAQKMRIPCGDGSRRIGWLQSEVIRRWADSHDGDVLRILELKTSNNVSLDYNDQIAEVLHNDDLVLAVLKICSSRAVQVGDMFAHRYYLTEVIGEGTYGHVFKARDLELERDVALKCLKKSRANRINTKRFLREAQVTAKLGSNPNIVTLFDSGRADDGTLFLVMELLKGESMAALLERHMNNREAISEPTCIQMFVPLLSGLHAAHSHDPPIVHRDLKPDNVFLVHNPTNGPPTPVLLDFGIAVSTTLSQDTAPCGTRMYSSPEQTRKGEHVDPRSDLWSIGVMIYQCVTLFIDMPFDPFELRSPDVVVPDVREHVFDPISDGFAVVIMRALEKDVSKRWQSAAAFRQALIDLAPASDKSTLAASPTMATAARCCPSKL